MQKLSLMLIWIKALLSEAAEIKTMEGKDMLISVLSSPVIELSLHNTFSLTRLDGITIVGKGYDLFGSVQF